MIINGAIGSIVSAIVLALLLYVLRKLVKAAPWIWNILQRRLGKIGASYEQFIDSLVNDKDAQLRIYLELVVCWVLLSASLIIATIGAVVSVISDLPEAPSDAIVISIIIEFGGMALGLFAGVIGLLIASALEIAKKREKEQNAQTEKDSTIG